MTTTVNPYIALLRRLEMTLARQKTALAETELQVEAARKMVEQHAKTSEKKA